VSEREYLILRSNYSTNRSVPVATVWHMIVSLHLQHDVIFTLTGFLDVSVELCPAHMSHQFTTVTI